MMQGSGCHEHGNLVRDLARGRLGDAEAEEAETILSSCASCAAWWSQHLENEPAMRVDLAVRESLASFTVPRSRRQRQWWAAAAAVILALVTGALWYLGSSPAGIETQARYETPIPVLQPEQRLISKIDFEPENANPKIVIVGQKAPEVTTNNQQGALFTGDFESGSLDRWSPTT